MKARVLRAPTAVSSLRWTKEDRDRFTEHAAPEAISAALSEARIAQAKAAALIRWLETLLARRNQQICDGSWPRKSAE